MASPTKTHQVLVLFLAEVLVGKVMDIDTIGLLYMLLALVIHYFASGYSAMDLPFPINPLVTVYLTPLLFLSGLGLTLYGFYVLIQTQ